MAGPGLFSGGSALSSEEAAPLSIQLEILRVIGDLHYSVIYYNYQNALLTLFCISIRTNCSVNLQRDQDFENEKKKNSQRMLVVVVK